MSVIQPYLANALMNHIFRQTAFTMPSHAALALFVGAVEVTGGGYARQDMIGTSPWNPPSSGLITNTGLISFPAATTAWGQVDHFGFYDALTGGNLLWYDILQTARIVNPGDVFEFAIAQIQLQQQ